MEENLWSEKAFVSHVYVEVVLADGVDAFIFLDPFRRVCVVLAELFYDVWADVAEPFL